MSSLLVLPKFAAKLSVGLKAGNNGNETFSTIIIAQWNKLLFQSHFLLMAAIRFHSMNWLVLHINVKEC